MEQTNKSGFDREWKAAFSGAEVKPPEHVWESIEHQLAKGSGNGKRGLMIFPWLVAAMLAFALTITGILYLGHGDETSQELPLAENDNPVNQLGEAPEDQIPAGQDPDSQSGRHGAVESGISPNTENTASPGSTGAAVATAERKGAHAPYRATKENSDKGPGSEDMSGSRSKSVEPRSGSTTLAAATVPEDIDPIYAGIPVILGLSQARMQGVPYYAASSTHKRSTDGLWASIGVSAGGYNGNSAPSGNQNYSFASSTSGSVKAYTDEETSGQVINFGANVGSRLGQRWVLQGGIGYLERTSGGQSNVVSTEDKQDNVVSMLSNALAERKPVQTIEDYSFDDTYQVISVPVQVGYILLDRKVGITVLSGVSNDLLLQRKLEADNGSVNDVIIKPGDSEAYNTYGVSALVTTEVNYHLGDNYSITVFPQLRQSLRTLNNEEVQSDAEKSMIWELGFRFRYLIR